MNFRAHVFRIEEELQNLATIALSRDVYSLHAGLLKVNELLSLVLTNQKDIMSAQEDFNAALKRLDDAVSSEEGRERVESGDKVDAAAATSALHDLAARVENLSQPAPAAADPASPAPAEPAPAPAEPTPGQPA